MKNSHKRIEVSLFCVGILLLFAGISIANIAGRTENILGDWEFTMDMGDMGGMGGPGGGMTVKIDSTFTKGQDGKITGTWVMNFERPEGMQGGPVGGFAGGDFQMPTFKIVDVKIDGQKLSFTRKAEGDTGGPGGMMMQDRNFTGTIKGDAIELTTSSDYGEMNYKGTRKAAAPVLEGDWLFKMTMADSGMGMGQMEFTINSTVTKDAEGKYSMTWKQVMNQPEGGVDAGFGGGNPPTFDVKVEDIKLDGNKLTFVRKVNMGDAGGMGGGEMVSNFSGTLEGDKINGTVSSDFGEMKLTGTRVATVKESPKEAVQAAPAGLEGDWEFVTTFGDMGMEMSANASFKKDADGKYAGKWEMVMPEGMGQRRGGNAGGMQPPQIKIEDIKLDGDKVTFVQKFSMGDMGEMTSSYSGTLKGDKIEGTLTNDYGESKSIGTRKKAAETPAAAPAASAGSNPLVGDWQFTMSFGGADTGMGNREFIINSTFTKKDDGTYSATWERQVTEGQGQRGGGGGGFGGGERPAVSIKDIKLDGNKLTFVQSINFNGQEMSSNFSGTIENGKITGTMTSDMMGEMPIAGTKKK